MLLRNVIVNYMGTIWAMIMSLAFIPVYIQHLGLEAYGLIGIFAVLVTVFSLFDLGMTPTISREMARFTGGGLTGTDIRILLRSIEVILFGVGAIISLLLFAASWWIATAWVKAETLSADQISFAIGLMGGVIALRFPEGLYRASLQGLQKQVQANVLNAGVATLRAMGAWAVLVWIDPSIQAFFIWQIAVSAISVMIHAIVTYKILPRKEESIRFSLQAVRDIYKFASGVMGITFLAILLTQVDKIILSRMLALADYGIYALAASVSVAIYNLVSPVTTAFYPRMAQLFAAGDAQAAQDVFHAGAKALTVIGGTAALTIAILAKPIIYVWTGDAALADAVAPILTLLMLGSLLNIMLQMPYHAQLALGRTRISVISNLIAVVIIVPMLIVTAKLYGAIGAAVVWPILNLGYIFIAAPAIFHNSMPGSYSTWLRNELIWPLSGPCVILLGGLWAFSDDQTRGVQAAIVFFLTSVAFLSSGLQAGYWEFIKRATRRVSKEGSDNNE